MSVAALTLSACATDGGSSGSSGDAGDVAAGAVEDALQACLARISSDASAGQRTMAQESCERDQANRK